MKTGDRAHRCFPSGGLAQRLEGEIGPFGTGIAYSAPNLGGWGGG